VATQTHARFDSEVLSTYVGNIQDLDDVGYLGSQIFAPAQAVYPKPPTPIAMDSILQIDI